VLPHHNRYRVPDAKKVASQKCCLTKCWSLDIGKSLRMQVKRPAGQSFHWPGGLQRCTIVPSCLFYPGVWPCFVSRTAGLHSKIQQHCGSHSRHCTSLALVGPVCSGYQQFGIFGEEKKTVCWWVLHMGRRRGGGGAAPGHATILETAAAQCGTHSRPPTQCPACF
jgi:hypothetical protein